MIVFGERLKLLRINNNLTQLEIANEFNIQVRSYQRYEANKSFPNFEKLIDIADYYKVSIDYLVGRCNDPNSHKN